MGHFLLQPPSPASLTQDSVADLPDPPSHISEDADMLSPSDMQSPAPYLNTSILDNRPNILLQNITHATEVGVMVMQ